MAGSISGSRFLLALGSLSGAAPLPRVFRNSQGIDTFARRARVELVLADGSVREFAIDRNFGAAFDGPVVRMAAYAHAAMYAGLPGTDPDHGLLRFGFCRRGPAARALGVEEEVVRVRVVNQSALANDEPLGEAFLVCAP